MNFKKCKVVMLPTEEKATVNSLALSKNELIILTKTEAESFENARNVWTLQHLHITCNDVIKEGDWCFLNLDGNSRATQVISMNSGHPVFTIKITEGYAQLSELTKIISSTDTSMGLPQPSRLFVEKFTKCYNKGEIISDVSVEIVGYKAISVNAMNKLSPYENILWQYDGDGLMPKSIYLKSPDGMITNSSGNGFIIGEDIIEVLKINPNDNTITIRKVKDNYSRLEVIQLINKFNAFQAKQVSDYFHTGRIMQMDARNWIEENV